MNHKTITAILGIAVFTATIVLPAPAQLDQHAWWTAGLAMMMALFWIGEVLPLAITALLPLIIAPILGLTDLKSVGANYGHPLIFLFLGGFVLGLSMERWSLHRRIALGLTVLFGGGVRRQLATFMGATAFLSMWVSNTATAIMMLPIALSILSLNTDPSNSRQDRPLLLGIAYSASIGGIATLIGTPPNALMAAYLADVHNIHLSFVGWMAMAVPLSAALLLAAWLWLSRQLPRGDGSIQLEALRQQWQALGPMTPMQWRVALVFIITAGLWITRPLFENALPDISLSDTSIALIAAVALHTIPAADGKGSRLMDWDHTRRLPWGVLLLFGGGLALAHLMTVSGLAETLAQTLQGLGSWPLLALIFAVVGVIMFLTEVTSNTATAAAFLPLIGSLAVAVGAPPEALVVPAALAASCAFMLPVATPPNAIVFGAERLTVGEMARTGFVINVLAWLGIGVLGWVLIW
ncbi:DASS family sodium-coupled anion symporter [Gilvimarinus agarilyticus]|uniref:SLC13 family permease n=1 Tax=Gilvimarinus sp. 2_MG-2023 TaxID=3062666 RepID=UPI001C096B88|nr:DASS family sodium-coupled anion symporter [Gilvimarinus sp. 2_MG-2023]MBU2884793.1 DASS family sodium-coupled anion symporter [Gilvimarinus agarilyticus]MDO6569843.1 DASS family sodium-coupled anion symporter [Gilvimarinus sp. 2_MG-2023]